MRLEFGRQGMTRDPQPELLHVRFREQALRTPNRTALIAGDDRVTYGELLESVEAVARGLKSLEGELGRPIGLHLDRSIAWASATLGILTAGSPVVPLPLTFPVERLRRIMEAASIDLVVTDDGPHELAARKTASVSQLAGLSPRRDNGPTFPAASPTNPAFVLSSSGSTGSPKLIVRSHRSFFHRLSWTWERHPYVEGDVCCQKAHMTTTHSIYELFEPLLAGVPVVLLSDDTVRDLDSFWRTLEEHAVSRLLIVPSYLRVSLEAPGFAPPSLRVLVLMGEPVDGELAERTVAAFPASTSIYSIYGSTEASSTLVCDLREPWGEGAPPLGVPMSDSVVPMVLKSDGSVARPGERGRLHIAGPPVFDGYLGRDGLAETVLSPSSETGPVYDTRDDVLVASHGTLRYLGRADHVVKVRGYRVDLLEVEGTLLKQPEVTAAAVVVQDRGVDGVLLAGFVSPADVEIGSLRARLAEVLPEYMVPSRLLAVETMPLTDSGKVDRATLKASVSGARAAEGARAAAADLDEFSDGSPRPRTESVLRREWIEVLGHDHFGREHTFFEVGGTSLTVFSLVHRLRKALGLSGDELSAETVYRFPTIATLAERLDAPDSGAEGVGGQPTLVRLRRGSVSGAAPLFVVGSAGGTVGAYEKMVGALETDRDVFGIRDPFLWGARDPGEGFHAWIDAYMDAIRRRQPKGPYYLCAYSSAGAFGYEIARRFRASGEAIGLLVLIDPLAMDRGDRSRFGYWVLRSTYGRGFVRAATRTVGLLRRRWSLPGSIDSEGTQDGRAFSVQEMQEIADGSLRDPGRLMMISALMELDTGLPLALDEGDLGLDRELAFDTFLGHLEEQLPELDREMIRRIVVQYEVQVRSQHAYRLSPLDAPVLLFEPKTRYAGLIAAQLRPYVRDLKSYEIELSKPTQRTAQLCERFGALAGHYRSIRDPHFVEAVAREVSRHLVLR